MGTGMILGPMLTEQRPRKDEEEVRKRNLKTTRTKQNTTKKQRS
jgi:hypothetical protein